MIREWAGGLMSEKGEPVLLLLLGRYLYKEDLQDLLENLDEPVSGSKDDLIGRLIGNEDFDAAEALAFLDKDQLKRLCEEADLPSKGTRDELFERALDAIEEEQANESAALPVGGKPDPAVRTDVSTSVRVQAPPTPAPPPQQPIVRAHPQPDPGPIYHQAPQQSPVSRGDFFRPQEAHTPPLVFPDNQPPTSPSPKAPLEGPLHVLSEFFDTYRPSARFKNEMAYEVEVAAMLRAKFGEENVRTQVSIYGGRIDLEVMGVGIELKVPATRGNLQTLLGQVATYANFYGPNLIVVIMGDLARVQDVNEFAGILRQRGISVFAK